MDKEQLFSKITQKTNSKILLIVLDGVGGAPFKNGLTELEAANTPNLDELSKKSSLGLTHPVLPGITPGSGPAHLALFGYDPVKYDIGRGVLENLGLGVELKKGDIAIRGNFCTVKEENGRLIVVDRRAGRIPTEENKRLCKKLSENINRIEDVEVLFTPGREHRVAIRLRGEGLNAGVNDTDPQKEGKQVIEPKAITPNAQKLADILTELMKRIRELLKDEPRANFMLFRGISEIPAIPSMRDIFKLTPAAVATYPMYKGLAQLVGMDVLDVPGEEIEDEIHVLEKIWHDYDFFYLHIKKTDSYGEDGNFEGKVKIIEKFDSLLPQILKLKPDVLVITGDHSTPAVLKSHSWHPNPFLLYSSYSIPLNHNRFTERECAKGYLGVFRSEEAMGLILAHALKLKKYGA